MKYTSLLLICGLCLILSGCSIDTSFMVPKEDSQTYKSNSFTGMFSGLISDEIKSDLSGSRNEIKGYAAEYYDDELSGYVNDINQHISGSIQALKDKHNQGVDRVSDYISDEVESIIKAKLDTLKL